MARYFRGPHTSGGHLSPPVSPRLPHILKRRRSASNPEAQAHSEQSKEGSILPDITGLKRTDIGAPQFQPLLRAIEEGKGAHEMLSIVIVEAQDLVREISAYVRVGRRGFLQETGVQRKTRNPVWNELTFTLREPGAVVSFELRDKDKVGSCTVGCGDLCLDEAFLATVTERHPKPHETWVDLMLKDKPAGRLRLRVALDPRNKPYRILHEFREVGRSEHHDRVHYVEPQFRQLRVKLKRCVVATSPSAQVYLVVQCGLFEAMSEWHFVDAMQASDGAWIGFSVQQPGLQKVDFNEDFAIGVPQRTPGCTLLPDQLKWTKVEMSLYLRNEQLPDELIGQVQVPFSEVAGFGGDPVDPSAPPWLPYVLAQPHKAKIKRTVKDAFAKVADHEASAGDSTVEAALYFDTSYDEEAGPSLGPATLRFVDLHVPRLAEWHGTFSLYVVIRCGRHWVRFSLPRGQAKVDVDRQFEFEVQEPRMMVTVAVMARDETATSNVTENVASRLSRADRPLGVLHLRPASVTPWVWNTSTLELLTRGKGKCRRNGTLTLSMWWKMPLGLQVVSHYLKPPLPVRYYYEPWTAQQTNLFGQFRKAAIVLYLDKQPAPIKSDCSNTVLAHEFTKFDRVLLKAHMNRMRNAAGLPKALSRLFNKVRYWEHPGLSAAVNVAWVAFVHYPLEGLTMLVACWVMALVYKVCTLPMAQGLHQKDPGLFGGVVQDVSESDGPHGAHALPLPHNPVRVLQESLERFESAGGRMQTVAHQLACAMESANGAFLMTDLIITAIFMAASIALLAALWVLPFSLVLSVVGCYMLRHPRFRTKTPSKVLCLAARLPNKADEVIYARAN